MKTGTVLSHSPTPHQVWLLCTQGWEGGQCREGAGQGQVRAWLSQCQGQTTGDSSGTGWTNSTTWCVERAGLGMGLAGGPAPCAPRPCRCSPILTVLQPGWAGAPGVPWAWPAILHALREALGKDFQWPLHFYVTQLGGVVVSSAPALALSIGQRGWVLSDQPGTPRAGSVVLGSLLTLFEPQAPQGGERC